MFLNKTKRALVSAVLESLREHPEDWEPFMDFEVTHRRSGISVWTASGAWGLDVKHNGRRLLGGVVVFALASWRYQLLAAAKPLLVPQQPPAQVALDALTAA